MRVDDQVVVEAHLNHFCPGGASFPVTDSRPIGLDLEAAAGPPEPLDAAAPRAGGQRCERCGQPITRGQDARRRATDDASGAWVHESCPRP